MKENSCNNNKYQFLTFKLVYFYIIDKINNQGICIGRSNCLPVNVIFGRTLEYIMGEVLITFE
jgi:hypothetical protein